MKGDLLEAATRSLRESVDGASEGAQATEGRVLSMLPRHRRRRLIKPWGLALVALFIGSSVWAMGGAPVRSWLRELTDATPVGTEQRAPTASKPRSPFEPSQAPAPSLPPPSPPPGPLEPPEPPEPPAGAAPEPRSAASGRIQNDPPLRPIPVAAPTEAAPESPSAGPSAPGGDAALDVYEQAHDLHFKARDYARALAAWNRYLELAPTGSLALEARFHRGVCWARLGQMEEAQRALGPFARGDYGTYRQAQARKLLGQAP